MSAATRVRFQRVRAYREGQVPDLVLPSGFEWASRRIELTSMIADHLSRLLLRQTFTVTVEDSGDVFLSGGELGCGIVETIPPADAPPVHERLDRLQSAVRQAKAWPELGPPWAELRSAALAILEVAH